MERQHPIRVVIIDYQTIARKGVAAILASQTDIEVIGDAASCAAGLELCQRLHPDVAITEFDFPDEDGLALMAALVALPMPCPVLVLATENGSKRVQAALAAG